MLDLKIRKEINRTCLYLLKIENSREHKCMGCQLKSNKKIAQEGIQRELRNQNGEHLVNLCESNIFEAKVIFPIVN